MGDPHVVLELRHVLFGGGFFGGGLRQHELGLEFGHETSGARRRVVPASDAKNTGLKEDQDRFHRTPLVASCFKATRGEAARIENAFMTLDQCK